MPNYPELHVKKCSDILLLQAKASFWRRRSCAARGAVPRQVGCLLARCVRATAAGPLLPPTRAQYDELTWSLHVSPFSNRFHWCCKWCSAARNSSLRPRLASWPPYGSCRGPPSLGPMAASQGKDILGYQPFSQGLKCSPHGDLRILRGYVGISQRRFYFKSIKRNLTF